MLHYSYKFNDRIHIGKEEREDRHTYMHKYFSNLLSVAKIFNGIYHESYHLPSSKQFEPELMS
jgi:hypothetical protein